jgi:hypothetical protein
MKLIYNETQTISALDALIKKIKKRVIELTIYDYKCKFNANIMITLVIDRKGMMLKNDSVPITGAEWEVMRVIWANEKVISRDIIEILFEKNDGNQLLLKHYSGV